MCHSLRDGQISTATRIPAEFIASDASCFAVFNGAIDYVIQNNEKCNKTTWYTSLQGEQAVGARDVRAKGTETCSGANVGFASRAASRSGPTRPPRREMWPGTESNCRHEDFQSSALPTELPGQKPGIFLKSCRESRLTR